MRNVLAVLAVLALGFELGRLLETPALGQTASNSDCVVGMVGAPAAMERKWEEQMDAWLAAGKTRFVSNPNGVCAY